MRKMIEQNQQPSITETIRLLTDRQTKLYNVGSVDTFNRPLDPKYRTPKGFLYFLREGKLPILLANNQIPHSEEEARKRFIDEMNA